MEIRENGEVHFFHETVDFETFINGIRNMSSLRFYDNGLGQFVFWLNGNREAIEYKKIPEYYRERIFNVLQEREREKLKNNLYNRATSSGKLPGDAEDKRLLAEYLKEKIDDTKATYIDARKTKLRYLAATALSPIMLTGGALVAGENPLLCGAIVAGALITSSIGLTNYIYSKDYTETLQSDINSDKEILSKLNVEEPNGFFEEIKENEYEDKEKVKKYNDKFINEVAKIAHLINQLPDNEDSPYRDRVNKIVDEYQKRINAIVDREDEITLGKATDAYTLLIEMLPGLYKIERELLAILKKEDKKDSINDEIEEVRSLLQGNNEHLKKVA